MNQSSRPPAAFGGVVGPLIIAHRGGSLEAPENTLAAIRHGVSCGADWQELDVTLTRDDAVIVIHDDSVDRTTDGHGEVARQNLSELRRLSAGRPRFSESAVAHLTAVHAKAPDFGDKFAAEHLPTLDEVLAVPGTRLMIELKKGDRGERLVDRVLEVLRKANALDRVALASFDDELLFRVSQREPSVPLIGIAQDLAGVTRHLELPVSVLAVSTEIARDVLARAPAKVAVWTWTIYSVEQAVELRDLGAHGLITDIPAALVAAMRPAGSVYVEPAK